MAEADGKGAKPDEERRSGPKLPADRPEAFGRGERPQQDGKGNGPDEEQGDQKDGGGKQGDQGEEQKDPRPFWKRPVLMTVLIAVLLGAVAGGGYLAYLSYHFETTDDAFIDGRIIRVAPRVAGKVLRRFVDDNQFVEADDRLIEIDKEPFEVALAQRQAAQKQAEAQVAQAQANLAVAEASAAQADADVTVAQANAANAQRNFDRFNKVGPEARSQQQLDQATADQKATAATVVAQQKRAESMHQQAKASQTAIEAALASVDAAKTQVEDARLNLGYCTVKAGHRGRVTRRTVEVGNYVAVQQEILDVVPTDAPTDIWVTANFKESQLAHMRRGQRVTIKVDAFPDQRLHGHVDSIQNGTGAVFSLLPPENATGNYVKVVQRIPVKIVLDEQPRHMLSPGLSVVPEVDIGDRPDPTLDDTVAHPLPAAAASGVPPVPSGPDQVPPPAAAPSTLP